MDYQAVVTMINQGGLGSLPLEHVIEVIQSPRTKNHLHLSAFHVRGVHNVIADNFSRAALSSTEWTLDAESFQLIALNLPDLQIDLAESSTHQLRLQVSPTLKGDIPTPRGQQH